MEILVRFSERKVFMTVRIFYVDESYDSEKFCLSAMGIRHQDWKDCFREVRQHRQILKKDYGIYIRKEIHAHKFISGRGEISDRTISKWERSRIFFNILNMISRLPRVMLINICIDVKGRKDPQLDAWDRLLNRIERTMLSFEQSELSKRKELVASITGKESSIDEIKNRLEVFRPKAIIIADEGREAELTKIFRKMNIYNPIPSQMGMWADTGRSTKNIPVERIIEDPVFKKSQQSFFIQLVDCIAFSLLKRETAPTKNINKYGIDKMFEKALSGICFKKAHRNDPLGIVRK